MNKVYILGVGSIGSLLAVNLALYTDATVIPLFRTKKKVEKFQNVAQNTLTINQLFSRDCPSISSTFTHSECPETLSDGTHLSNLVITTKTYQTKEALQPYLPYIDHTTNLILVQNGLGTVDILKEEVFTDKTKRPRLFQGVISHGVYQKEEFVYNHAGLVNMNFANIPWDSDDFTQSLAFLKQERQENELARIFTTPELCQEFKMKFVTYQQLLLSQIYKFLMNSCMNSVTAILDCVNGEMADRCRDIFTLIIKESIQVLQLYYKPLFEYDSKFSHKDEYPILNVNSTLKVTKLVDEIINIGCIVCAKNSTSMREDTRHLRETEIDFINGYILKIAKQLGLPADTVKVNATVTTLIKLRSSVNRVQKNKTIEELK